MNVASLELCKELYELSGWEGDAWFPGSVVEKPDGSTYPAYHLGYLLRKLPDLIDVYNSGNSWSCRFQSTKARQRAVEGGVIDLPFAWVTKADTPEDAAASLAIELFKQGVLTKESI